MFTPRHVAAFGPKIAQIADAHATRLMTGGDFDLYDAMADLTFDIAAQCLCSCTAADLRGSEVRRLVSALLDIRRDQLKAAIPTPPQLPTSMNRRQTQLSKALRSLIQGIVDDKRRATTERAADEVGLLEPMACLDLVDLLIAGSDEAGQPMPDSDIVDEAITFMAAGFDTSASTLGWTFVLLAASPEARDRLEGECASTNATSPSGYCDAVVKESLRLFPPVPSIFRHIHTAVTVGGIEFTKKSKVFINTVGIHRRADLYANPDTFLPDRFLNAKTPKKGTYLPFGDGPRVCIGAQMAMQQVKIALTVLCQKLRIEIVKSPPPPHYCNLILTPRGYRAIATAHQADRHGDGP